MGAVLPADLPVVKFEARECRQPACRLALGRLFHRVLQPHLLREVTLFNIVVDLDDVWAISAWRNLELFTTSRLRFAPDVTAAADVDHAAAGMPATARTLKCFQQPGALGAAWAASVFKRAASGAEVSLHVPQSADVVTAVGAHTLQRLTLCLRTATPASASWCMAVFAQVQTAELVLNHFSDASPAVPAVLCAVVPRAVDAALFDLTGVDDETMPEALALLPAGSFAGTHMPGVLGVRVGWMYRAPQLRGMVRELRRLNHQNRLRLDIASTSTERKLHVLARPGLEDADVTARRPGCWEVLTPPGWRLP